MVSLSNTCKKIGMKNAAKTFYWDSSAALSAILPDQHSDSAASYAMIPGMHVLSSLTWAEANAVFHRMERARQIDAQVARTSRDGLASEPWKWLDLIPDQSIIEELSGRWSLSGADLWHLAAAKTLQLERPEIMLLTFDQKLHAAAQAEGLA